MSFKECSKYRSLLHAAFYCVQDNWIIVKKVSECFQLAAELHKDVTNALIWVPPVYATFQNVNKWSGNKYTPCIAQRFEK